MAVTTTALDATGNMKVYEVAASADGDTTATIAHGITCIGADNAAKDAWAKANILPILIPLTAAAQISLWIAAVDRTNVTLTKGTGAGSGAAPVQLRVGIWKVFSMLE